MLGSDALGRLSLGQLSASPATPTGGYILLASVATFAVTARQTTRAIGRASATAAFAMVGNAAQLFASNVHQYVLTASVAVFSVTARAVSFGYLASRLVEIGRPVLYRLRAIAPKLTE